MERAVTFMWVRAGWGTTRFPAGSWEASSFAFALCGVFPWLLFPRESRSPPSSPDDSMMNGPILKCLPEFTNPFMACFRCSQFDKDGPGNCETPAGERGRRDPAGHDFCPRRLGISPAESEWFPGPSYSTSKSRKHSLSFKLHMT